MIALPKETWTIFQIRNGILSVLGQKSCKRHGSDIVTNRPPPPPPPPPLFPLWREHTCVVTESKVMTHLMSNCYVRANNTPHTPL